MAHRYLTVILAVSLVTCGSAAAQLTGQQASFPSTIPQFGGYLPNSGATAGFSNRSGTFFFHQGSAAGALPPFGGYVPGNDATLGIRLGGLGSLTMRAGQGSSQSSVSQSASLTVANGGTGFIASGTLQPFVTSFVPVVGSYVPSQELPASGWSAAPNRRVLDRQARQKAAIQRLVGRAERAKLAGQIPAAKMYYRMAIRRAVGEEQVTLQECLARLP